MSGIFQIARSLYGNEISDFSLLQDLLTLPVDPFPLSYRQEETHTVKSVNELGLKVFKEVFDKTSPFVSIVRRLIGNYIPDEAGCLLMAQVPYRDFYIKLFANNLDLSRKDVLKGYLGKKYQTDLYCTSASLVAQSIYEADSRHVGGCYGMVFPMSPEVLASAMQFLNKDTETTQKIAIEMGGASGENSALLAFTDADLVYLNDINRNEIEKFQQLQKTLPKKIGKKLKVMEGSCLSVWANYPRLINNVDLVFCRNVIHFFNPEEKSQLFLGLKKLLKPEGRAIFIVNAKDAIKNGKKCFKKHPEATCFNLTECFIHDFTNKEKNKRIFHSVSVCPESSFSMARHDMVIYERNGSGLKWQVNNEEFNKITSQSLQMKIQRAIARNKKYMKQIQKGEVLVLQRNIQAFSEESLTYLFKRGGFEIESTFALHLTGHLIPEHDWINEKQQVGIVCKKFFKDV